MVGGERDDFLVVAVGATAHRCGPQQLTAGQAFAVGAITAGQRRYRWLPQAGGDHVVAGPARVRQAANRTRPWPVAGARWPAAARARVPEAHL